MCVRARVLERVQTNLFLFLYLYIQYCYIVNNVNKKKRKRACAHGTMDRRIDLRYSLFLVLASVLQLAEGRGIYHPVCGIVHMKNPLLLIRKD